MSRAAKAALYAGIGFAALYGAQALPAVVPDAVMLVLAVSGLVTGFQAAQSTLVQVARIEDYPRFVLALIASLGASLILWGMVGGGSLPLAIGAIAMGAALGLATGPRTVAVMTREGPIAFQKSVAVRNSVILAVVSLASLAALVSGGAGIGALLVGALGILVALALTRDSAEYVGELPRKGARGSDWLGIAGSLFYRNDVNWVRAATVGMPEFASVHYAVLGYSVVQGMVGFAVVHFILSRRLAVRNWFYRVPRLVVYIATLVWALILTVSLVAFRGTAPVVTVAVAALVASMTGLMSGLAHACERSKFPYLAGTFATVVLVVWLNAGGDPAQGLLASASTTGLLIAIGLASARIR